MYLIPVTGSDSLLFSSVTASHRNSIFSKRGLEKKICLQSVCVCVLWGVGDSQEPLIQKM